MGDERIVCEISCRLIHARVSEDGTITCSRQTPLNSVTFPDIKLRQEAGQSAEISGDNGTYARTDFLQQQQQDTGLSVLANISDFWQETNEATRQMVGQFINWRSKQDSRQICGSQHLAWHSADTVLAVISGRETVQIFRPEAVKLSSTSQNPGQSKPETLLCHPELRQVNAIEFGPDCSDTLAIAGLNACFLWKLKSRNSSTQAGPYRILRPRSHIQLASVAWSPCGLVLASGHRDSPGFTIWDVPTGEATLIRTGLLPKTLLKWSPDSSYLFTASPDGSFQIWATEEWTHSDWKSPSNGEIVSAQWTPDSRTLLIAYSDSNQLFALMLIGEPPSLHAQILPVELPEIGKGITIKSMACDPQMQRLLVSYTEENGRASVLLYSTSRRPVLLVRFIGDISDESLEHIDSICFHQGLSQGALIAIKSGNTVRILPLLYDE